MIGRAPDIRSSEIADEQVYLRRRDFIRLAGGAVLATAGASLAAWETTNRLEAAAAAAQSPLQNVRPHVVSTDDRLNSFEEITSYNNFYEFGHHPKDPQRYAGRMKTSPWTVTIDGRATLQRPITSTMPSGHINSRSQSEDPRFAALMANATRILSCLSSNAAAPFKLAASGS